MYRFTQRKFIPNRSARDTNEYFIESRKTHTLVLSRPIISHKIVWTKLSMARAVQNNAKKTRHWKTLYS